MSLYFTHPRDQHNDRAATWRKLDSMGITKVVVHFSGGNDEGGADDYTATKADGTAVKLENGTIQRAYKQETYDAARGRFVETGYVVWEHDTGDRPATQAEIDHTTLLDALEQPIEDQYGSFAGEFYVHGTVVWDVPARKVHMDEEFEDCSWEHREYDL